MKKYLLMILLLSSTLFGQYSSIKINTDVIDSNCKGFWVLDSTWCVNNGVTFGNDQSSNANHLTTKVYTSLPSSTLFFGGGTSTNFATDGDLLTATDATAGIAGTTNRTVEAWIKVDTEPVGDSDTFIQWGTDATGQSFAVMINTSGRLRVEVGGGNAVGTANICDGEWHLIHAILPNGVTSTTGIIFKVDGVADATSGTGARTINTVDANAVTIGNGFVDRDFVGEIGLVAIYDKVVDDTHIAAMLEVGSEDGIGFPGFPW